MLSALCSELVLLPTADDYLSNDISFVYVLEFLSYEPKTRASCLFLSAARTPFALRTLDKSYCLPVTINFLMISASSMYVVAFLNYEPKTRASRSFF